MRFRDQQPGTSICIQGAALLFCLLVLSACDEKRLRFTDIVDTPVGGNPPPPKPNDGDDDGKDQPDDEAKLQVGGILKFTTIAAIEAIKKRDLATLRSGNDTTATVSAARGRGESQDNTNPGDFIVRFRKQPSLVDARESLDIPGVVGQGPAISCGSDKPQDNRPPIHFQRFQVNRNQSETEGEFLIRVADARKKLEAAFREELSRGEVEIFPNYVRKPAGFIPTDEHYDKQWHYPAINLDKAWEITRGAPKDGGDRIVVAVADTGIKADHPDFDGQIIEEDGFDFIDDLFTARDGDGMDEDPDDPGDEFFSFHGTHVSGTIAAKSDDYGVTGVAPEAGLQELRVLGYGGGLDSEIAKAIRYAAGFVIRFNDHLGNEVEKRASKPADVINLSLGGPGYSPLLEEAVKDAISQGVAVFAAAGNEDSDLPSYPAAFPDVIAVGSVTRQPGTTPDGIEELVRAEYSNRGQNLLIMAPGGDVLQSPGMVDGVFSTFWQPGSFGNQPQPSFVFYEGTSMAAPHAAGIGALMKSVNRSLSHYDILAILVHTARKTPDHRPDLYGHGVVDAFKAVQIADELGRAGDEVVYVLVIDADTDKIATTPLEVTRSDNYLYKFEDLEPGQYFVLAGTDTTATEGFICETGEYCGKSEIFTLEEKSASITQNIELTVQENDDQKKSLTLEKG